MNGIADRRITDALRARLATGPASLDELLVAARTAAGPAMRGQEGALHALLHGLVRSDKLAVVGRAAHGGAVYALPAAARAPSPDDPVPIPPPVSAAASRTALSVASSVRDPAARGRVVADVLAHRSALEAEGRLRDFGSVKAARTALNRVDRGRTTIVLPENGWERFIRFLRHEAPSMGVTLVILALVWRFGAEFRVIPSNSMQPVLKPGDRVIVQKLFGGELPERWEVVVFRKPSDGVVLVKRVAGLPGERLWIEDGDLFVDGKIAVKPDDVREAVREPLVRSVFAGIAAPPGWELPRTAGSLPGELRYRPALYGDEPAYVDESGRLEMNPAPRPLAHDVYVRVRFLDEGTVRLAYTGSADGLLGLEWGRAGARVRSGAYLGAGRSALPLTPVPGPKLASDEVELSYVDGVARISYAGETLSGAASTRGSLPSIFVSGHIRSVAIDRDVHYTNAGELATDPGNPYLVEPGKIFCLGDHSAHSGDSRVRTVGPIPLDRLIGPVRFRVWPPSRIGTVR